MATCPKISPKRQKCKPVSFHAHQQIFILKYSRDVTSMGETGMISRRKCEWPKWLARHITKHMRGFAWFALDARKNVWNLPLLPTMGVRRAVDSILSTRWQTRSGSLQLQVHRHLPNTCWSTPFQLLHELPLLTWLHLFNHFQITRYKSHKRKCLKRAQRWWNEGRKLKFIYVVLGNRLFFPLRSASQQECIS